MPAGSLEPHEPHERTEPPEVVRAPGQRPRARRVWPLRAAMVGIATVLGIAAGWMGSAGPWRAPAPESPPPPGVLWPNPRPVGEFALRDHHGRAFTRERLAGAWTFMFFGYTHCPDICPTTLATLREVEHRLRGHASAPRQHVFVSVDPARDKVEHLAAYVSLFGPAFLGVSGGDEELLKLARQVGAVFFRGEPEDDGSYFVEHTASIMLIDPRGRLVALFGMPHDAAGIVERFIEIERVVQARVRLQALAFQAVFRASAAAPTSLFTDSHRAGGGGHWSRSDFVDPLTLCGGRCSQ